MSSRSDFAYIQARLQARHGIRLDEAGWRSLRSNKTVILYIDRARATSLKRWVASLGARLSAHEIERQLRTEWRRYVAEVAEWCDERWRPAVRWLSVLPDLPVIAHLQADGRAPAWLGDDPVLAGYRVLDAELRRRTLETAGLGPFRDLTGEPADERWLMHLERIWPDSEQQALEKLHGTAVKVLHHLQGIEQAASLEERLARCEQALVVLMRREAMAAPAVFAHLGLVLVDLVRLRGDLLTRLLFQPAAREVRA